MNTRPEPDRMDGDRYDGAAGPSGGTSTTDDPPADLSGNGPAELSSGDSPQPPADGSASLEAPGTASPPGRVDDDAAAARPVAGSKRGAVWVWNVPLLIRSLVVLGTVLPTLVGLYFWQSGRIGNQLLHRAEVAADGDEVMQEVKWLERYLALRPDDVDIQVRVALRLDDHAEQPDEINRARQLLGRALVSLAVNDDDPRIEQLQRRLIERLVQLGGGWFIEVQRQITELDPPPDDAWALEMFARSRLSQVTELAQVAPLGAPQREQDFWGWAAAQPVGELLEMAAQANPDSVELAALLVSAYVDRPELFGSPENPNPGSNPEIRAEYAGRAAELVRRLADNKQSGYAQWTAYVYARRDDVPTEPEPIAELAEAALARLQQREPIEGSPAVTRVSLLPRWDVQLVLTHAAELTEGDSPSEAADLYKTLTELPAGSVAANQLELAYRGLGQALWVQDETDAALQAWRSGNQAFGGDSLLLLEPLAAWAAQHAAIDEGREALAQLVRAVETISLRIAGIARRGMDQERLDQLQAQSNAANWRADVLRARLDYREGQQRQAAQRLERGLSSQLTVDTGARIEAAQLLAAIYGQQNLWDLAGRVLDEACQMAPADKALRRQAAEAWRRASASTRAVQQWQRADDGSFQSALAYASAVSSSQSAKPPASRDPREVRRAIEQAAGRLASSGGVHPQAWRLVLLDLALPADMRTGITRDDAIADDDDLPPGMSPDAKQLIRLSRDQPQQAELQAITAMAMLRADQPAQADAALARLESIQGVDPLYLLEVRTRFALDRQGEDEAAQLLRHALQQSEDNSAAIARFAARFLLSISRAGQAIEVLSALPDQQHDTDSLLQLGELLVAVGDPSDGVQDATGPAGDLTIDVPAELDRVIAQLRQLEGDDGTHWRLVRATGLLRGGPGGRVDRQQLTEAAGLYAEITSRRPRWSRGLALGGRIALAEGNARRAVELFRRAIAEGDSQVSTVLRLVHALNRSGDVAGAEQELARVENLADSVGTISAMAIGLALGQGKYDGALDRARAGVLARPEDAQAHLVLAQTALVASRAQQQRELEQPAVSDHDAPQPFEHLRAEARDALNNALEVSRGRELSVWQTLFRYELETGGYSAARQLLGKLQDSPLPDRVRYLAVANGYLAINDWGQAQSWLNKAQQADPSDPNVPLARAAVAQTAGDTQGMIEALSQAQQMAPARDDLRRRLALALAGSAAAGDPSIPWQKINALLGTQRVNTSAPDRLLRALIMLNRQEDDMAEQGRRILGELVAEDDRATSDDAARILIGLEQAALDAADERDDASAKDIWQRCVPLYEHLTDRTEPNPADLLGYGIGLLRRGQIDQAQRISQRLDQVPPVAAAALELQLRMARANDQLDQTDAILQQWLSRSDGSADSPSLVVAAQVLLRLDLADLAVEQMAAAYQKNSDRLRDYLLTLVEAGRVDQGVQVCLDHYRQTPSPEPIAMLANAVIQTRSLDLVTPRVDEVLAEAIKTFSTDVPMLESIGTLRLTQERFADAADVYAITEKLNPISLITLNNLAFVLTELPGRQADALRRAKRAVELYGRNPELLDTLGFAQYRAGQLQEAEATFREVVARNRDPRFQFHLILILSALGNNDEAKQMWQQLDIERLNLDALTPHGREQFEILKDKLEVRRAS